MKLLILAAILLPGSLFAALDIPRTVYTMAQLAEAQAKATEDKEPLIFVYTDPGTT